MRVRLDREKRAGYKGKSKEGENIRKGGNHGGKGELEWEKVMKGRSQEGKM